MIVLLLILVAFPMWWAYVMGGKAAERRHGAPLPPFYVDKEQWGYFTLSSVGRWLRDIRAQQKANRIKSRKLAGLRRGIKNVEAQRRSLERLNMTHMGFVGTLEREHPELAPLIATHQEDRLRALHPDIP